MWKNREEERDYLIRCMDGAIGALANRNPLIQLGVANAKGIIMHGMEELERLYIEGKAEKAEKEE